MSQKSFLDNKKSRKNFPYIGRGVNQHMENSICFVVFIFESFPNVTWFLLRILCFTFLYFLVKPDKKEKKHKSKKGDKNQDHDIRYVYIELMVKMKT